jgi:hypothetical protein
MFVTAPRINSSSLRQQYTPIQAKRQEQLSFSIPIVVID